MTDINAELLRALNGPGPQHKKTGEDAFQFTEGEQGKLFVGNHVMTDSGIWIPQKGTDDGAAHTQLTGSNVEELFTEVRIDIPASSNIRVVERGYNLFTGLKEIEVFYSVVSGFDLRIRVEGFGGTMNTWGFVWGEDVFTGSDPRGASRIPVFGDTFRVIVSNETEEEQSIFVLGVRGYY